MVRDRVVALAVALIGAALGAAMLSTAAPVVLTWVALACCTAGTALALIETVWPSHRCPAPVTVEPAPVVVLGADPDPLDARTPRRPVALLDDLPTAAMPATPGTAAARARPYLDDGARTRADRA